MHLRNIIYCWSTIIKKNREKEEERLVEETAARQKVPAMYRALGRPHFIARLHRRRCARATPKRQCAGALFIPPLVKRRDFIRPKKCENNTGIIKEIDEQEKSLVLRSISSNALISWPLWWKNFSVWLYFFHKDVKNYVFFIIEKWIIVIGKK